MTDSAVIPIEDRDHKRSQALLKAIGLDRVPAEQRELALNIAKRYELDLLLKHLVLVDGRPYITRDGLLHVAHRSGMLDGIEVTDPELVGDFWRAKCSVYRKDMTRPFTYSGRYPAKGGNTRFAPEMAVKVSEVMALRRAFDVSAPVIEERWDMDAANVPAPEPVRSLSEQIAERAASLHEASDSQGGRMDAITGDVASPHATSPAISTAADAGPLDQAGEPAAQGGDDSGAPVDPPTAVSSPPAFEQCTEISPYGGKERCAREAGHKGNHKNHDRESW